MKEQISQEKLVQIYDLYKKRLFVSSLKIVKDHQSAEDVLQEVFFRLHKQDYSKIKERIDLWLFTVCRNLSIKIYHKRNRMVLLGDDKCDDIEDENLLDPSSDLMNKERVKKLLSFYKKISKKQLSAIKYRYYNDLEYKEIAKKLKTTSGNVGFMLSTGISKLRELFEKEKKRKIDY
jgi:RNA polymerase sigma-70 factor (ECF subfamily)